MRRLAAGQAPGTLLDNSGKLNNPADMDQLRAMRTFVRVVKAGSLRSAADELGVSRALVTKHLQDLERSLGAELLRRSTRRLTLTDVGESYFNVCTRVIGELDEAEVGIRESQAGSIGLLRILVPRSFGSGVFATALAEFVRANPGLEVSMILADSGTHSFGAEGDIDVAIRLWDIPADSALVARQVGMMRWTICASPAYLAEAGAPESADDLTAHKCLVHLRLNPDRVWRFADGRSVRVAGPLSANSALAIRRAALAGAGIALLPLYYVKSDIEAGRLRQILPGLTLKDRPVYAVLSNARFVPRRARTFIKFFADWCGQNL